MTARTNVVINDRAATPVAHTYTPDGDAPNGVHLFSEKTGVPLGNPRLVASLRKSSTNKYKPYLRLTIPVVQTQVINGVSTPVIVRTAIVELSATFDGLSSEQERKDAIGLLANCLATTQTQFDKLLTGLEDIW